MTAFHGVQRAIRGAVVAGAGDRAAALAYYGFLALPSAGLIASGVFGLVAGPNTVASVVDHLRPFLPGEALTLLHGTLMGLTSDGARSGRVIGLGVILALWTVTGAVGALTRALDAIWGVHDERSFIQRRVAGLVLVACLLLAAGAAMALVTVGPSVGTWIGDRVGVSRGTPWITWAIEWPVLAGCLVLAAAGLLRYGPANRPSGRFVSVGALMVVGVWVTASAGFAVFAAHFGAYNRAWGSLAAVAVTLTWLWLSGLAVLLGASFDASSKVPPVAPIAPTSTG